MFCMGNQDHEQTLEDSTAKKIQNYIFKYEEVLGKGNFGCAYSGYDVNTGKQVAIKVIKMSSIKSKVSEKLLQNEIEILKGLRQHPNVLKCCDVFTSVNNCYIITELCDHDLQKELQQKGRFHEQEIRHLVYGIYKGLQQLARNSIIHRDIKISNIFISKNGIPKIADFGFAIKANNTFKDLNIGSPLYMSPEGLIHSQYGPKTDVWSFGVLLYELINGETPLERCSNDEQLKSQILQPPRYLTPISQEFRQVIEACLTVDERKRPDIFQLGALPYFNRLFSQIEGRAYSLKESSHHSTQCTSDLSNKIVAHTFFQKEISYDNAVAFLHYCRLLYKINKKLVNSQILSQFLLNFSLQLTKVKINQGNAFNEQLAKLKQVLHEYYNKFVVQHDDMKFMVNPREILTEIEKALKIPKLRMNKALEALDSQTKMLIYSIQHQKPEVFSKNSEAKKIIQTQNLKI